ncbi:MAG: DUF368 domain-containing protein [Coprobacillus sp.]|nr:DUF368 domain-containing protein [Coprobacillus sp.]
MEEKTPVSDFFKRLAAGLAIGVSAVIPGISGATTAVVLKVYNQIIHAFSYFIKEFVKSLIILIPIVLGVIIAMIPCVYLFNLAFRYCMFAIVCIFGGLIVGCFPSLTDEVKGEPIKNKYIVGLVIGIVVAVGLGVMSILVSADETVTEWFARDNWDWWFYVLLIIVGFISSFSLVVPGVSGSLIMLIIGFFTPLIGWVVDTCTIWFTEGLSNGLGFQLGMVALTFFGGYIIGVFSLSKVMHFFLKNYRLGTYYVIIGVVIGSFVALFFNGSIWDYYGGWASGVVNEYARLPQWAEILIGVVLFVGAGAFGYWFIQRYRKIVAENEAAGHSIADNVKEPTKENKNTDIIDPKDLE